MILFLANLPVSESNKISRLVARAQELYNSDFYDIEKQKWLADKLTIESLFPEWIIKESKSNPNVLVISLIKNYMRWLLSLENGYGAQLNWENIRTPLLANKVFYEAYLDFYFPGADFSQPALKNKIFNVLPFSVRADTNYFNIKGTPAAIKYLICNLLGIPWNSIIVFTGNNAVMTIQIATAYTQEFEDYKPFLEKHVFPAGVSVVYGTV